MPPKDDKKPGDKLADKPADKPQDKQEEKKQGITIEVIIVAVVIFGALFVSVQRMAWWQELTNGTLTLSTFISTITSFIPQRILVAVKQISIAYITLATFLSFFFLVGTVYALIRWRMISISWYEQLYPTEDAEKAETIKNPKWERVLGHINSDNPSDWRLSILEADIVLDELLDSLGYIGDTIGDKLKKATKGDFQTLDAAWEAHKIRNAIAHEGSDFQLTQREAQRIIGLYRTVFEEFDYI
ncbi:MAG: hypothetical protein M3Q64_00765 [bacterium]|nr:hypothetical protein [bacterium]